MVTNARQHNRSAAGGVAAARRVGALHSAWREVRVVWAAGRVVLQGARVKLSQNRRHRSSIQGRTTWGATAQDKGVRSILPLRDNSQWAVIYTSTRGHYVARCHAQALCCCGGEAAGCLRAAVPRKGQHCSTPARRACASNSSTRQTFDPSRLVTLRGVTPPSPLSRCSVVGATPLRCFAQKQRAPRIRLS
jgi:hypothetical protein